MKTKDLKPTEEQLAILDSAAKRHGSLMVNAGAGCAKSSTLKMAARQIKVPSLAVAFNAKIAKELAQELPANFNSMNLNSMGHRAWAKSQPKVTTLTLDKAKLGKLVTATAKDLGIKLEDSRWEQVLRLTQSAMKAGVVPLGDPSEANTLVEDTSETWVDLGLTNGLTLSTAQELWALSREILVRNIQLARAGIISFDDQIYCSTLLGGHFTKFPTVFVDEDQDLSPLDILMVSKALAPTGRLFAVGDKRQAIYAFRGASGEAAELIRKLRPSEEWTDHPLMLSFRCPQLVAERQQFHAPGFRAWHTNPQGRVERWQALPEGDEVWDGWTTKSIANAMPQSNSTVAILCRNNGPLFSMAFKLLRQSIGVQMLGRDFGKGLVALSKKIEPNDATEIQRFVHKLLDWKEKEIAQLLAVKKDEKIEFVLDKHECFLAVIESGGARTTGELRGLLEKLFARDSGLITLGSIHRAKGLEWDLVIHLDPWRIPSKQAKAMANAGDPIPLQQEWNLNYVVETRTKHTLVLADKSGFR